MNPDTYSLMRRMEPAYWWYRARRDIICDVVRRYLPPSADLLDFGSGTGATAAALQSMGYHMTAADTAEEALAACAEAGLTLIDVRRDWPPPASADGVLACDTLEHVRDDLWLMRSLRDILRSHGWLFVTAPAYPFLWGGEDHVSRHFRRYTRRSLVTLVCSAGYMPIWCSYFNTLLFPAMAGVILARRWLRRDAMRRTNLIRVWRPVNELLYRLFASERRLLRDRSLAFGGSIFLVARRRD